MSNTNPEPATIMARDIAWERKLAIRELVAAMKPIADAWRDHGSSAGALSAITLGDLARIVDAYHKHEKI